MDINEIMDVAKNKNSLRSDRALARAIGSSQPTVFRFRQGFSYPSEANMMKIGELAGISRAEALLLLNMCKAEGEAKNTYSDILRRLALVAGCFIMLIVSVPANAAIPTVSNDANCYVNSKIMYIMENKIGI
ncbi:MAG: hypothetical protein AAB276_01515 [Pseudomonadota bacterium]